MWLREHLQVAGTHLLPSHPPAVFSMPPWPVQLDAPGAALRDVPSPRRVPSAMSVGGKYHKTRRLRGPSSARPVHDTNSEYASQKMGGNERTLTVDETISRPLYFGPIRQVAGEYPSMRNTGKSSSNGQYHARQKSGSEHTFVECLNYCDVVGAWTAGNFGGTETTVCLCLPRSESRTPIDWTSSSPPPGILLSSFQHRHILRSTTIVRRRYDRDYRFLDCDLLSLLAGFDLNYPTF